MILWIVIIVFVVRPVGTAIAPAMNKIIFADGEYIDDVKWDYPHKEHSNATRERSELRSKK